MPDVDFNFWIPVVFGTLLVLIGTVGFLRQIYERIQRPPSDPQLDAVPTRKLDQHRRSFVGQLSRNTFLLGCGLCLLMQSPLPVPVVLLAWGIGYWAQSRDNRRVDAELTRRRTRQAGRYPSLAHPPPLLGPDQLPDQPTFAAFDATSEAPIGTLTRDQLMFLLRWQAGTPTPEFNDMVIIEEELDEFASANADPALIELLRGAMVDDEGGVELRWTLALGPTEEEPIPPLTTP